MVAARSRARPLLRLAWVAARVSRTLGGLVRMRSERRVAARTRLQQGDLWPGVPKATDSELHKSGLPPLEIKSMLESNPPKSRFLA